MDPLILAGVSESAMPNPNLWTMVCNAMYDMIIVAEYPSLHIRFSNPAASYILSYSQEQIQQLTLPDLFPPSHHPHLQSTLDTLIHRTPVRKQERLLTRDGTPVAVEIQYSLIQPNEPNPLSILCIAREAASRPILKQPPDRANLLSKAIIDAAPIGIFSYDCQGRITLVNRTQLRLNRIPDNIPAEHFFGMPILEQNSTIVANGLLDPLRQVLEGHAFDREILNFITRNREEISAHIQGVPLCDEYGTIVGGLVMVEDVSARVNYHLQLQKSEARYRWLVKALPDLMLRVDEEGRFVDFEEAKVRLYAAPEQFLERTITEVMPPDVANRAIAALKATLSTNTIQTLEYQLHVDGKMRDYEARLAPINAHEALVVVRDVTEHIRIARELIESEKRFRSLAEALPDLVFHLDHQGTYLDFHVPPNAGYFEPERQDIIGKTISDIIPADATDAALPAFYKAVRTGEITVSEYTIREPGGQRHYECRFSPTASQEIIAVVRDVTKRKQYESLLQNIAQATQHLLAAGNLDAATANDALGLLGDALNATCVFLFEGQASAQTDRPALIMRGQWSGIHSDEERCVSAGTSRPWPVSIADWYSALVQGKVIRQMITLSPDDDLALLTGLKDCSLLIVPVFADEMWWGMLVFGDSQSSRQWTHGDESALSAMAASIGGVIRRNRIEADLRRASRNADILREAGQVITSKYTLPEIFAHLLDQIRRIIDFDTANVTLFDHDHPGLIAAVGYDMLGLDEANVAEIAQTMLDFPLIRHILSTREAVICADVTNHPEWISTNSTSWIKSWIGVPIVLRSNTVIGIFSLESTRPDAYGNPDLLLPIVTAIAKQAAIAVEHARYYEQIQRRNSELSTLQQAGRAVLSDLKLDEMLLRLAQEMARIAEATSVIICRSDPEAQDGIVEISFGRNGTRSNPTLLPPRTTIDVTHRHIQVAFKISRSLILDSDSLTDVFPNVPSLATAQWLVVVPLRSNGQIRGFVLLCNHEPGHILKPEQITICESLADQVTLMLDQARLFEDIHALERIKSRMINMASHDLRGPLTRICNALITLEDGSTSLNSDQRDAIDTARRAVNDMDTMMRRLLSLKRIEEQHQKAEPVVWSEVIANGIASQEDDLRAKDQTLRLDTASDLPSTLGDPVQLTHALANLIQNAIKFTPPHGEIRVKSYVKDYGGKPCVAVEVEDTGNGIPTTLQRDLFTPFYRAQHEDSPDIPGIGLGLWIVKATIEDHHGRVYFDSVPQRGSMFGFWVPVD